MRRLQQFLAFCSALLCCVTFPGSAQQKSYAERLGWGPRDKVVIFHIDDVGMSHDSNVGTIKSMEQGLATSCSIMMPCSWVPEFFHYLQQHPQVDAGLHLTLTSEWKEYRWGPLAGKTATPGLVDKEGCLWGNVGEVVQHATADEVETEIRAQVDRAKTMGFDITHLDTHMGTVYATPEFLQRYVKVAMEEQIPVMVPAGHMQFIGADEAVRGPEARAQIQALGETLWNSGLPVLDDLYNETYGWKKEEKVDNFIATLKEMRPGLTQFIIHATEPMCNFSVLTTSSNTREGDMLAMLDPRLKQAIADQHIILTTWRELKQRRDQAGK
ncbi:MAG: polysaccharide deacetylase family protein [Candidatus Hydrogenedentes bacterium]|nr:polysaccharide deacetylase family protein [Candidatus Hydrogenedentota bacterium]